MEPIEIIFKTLDSAAKPMKASEIAEATNLDKKEVDKAMKVLKSQGRIESPKNCYWTAAR